LRTLNELKEKIESPKSSREDIQSYWGNILNKGKSSMIGTSNSDKGKSSMIGTSNSDKGKSSMIGTSNSDKSKSSMIGTSNSDNAYLRKAIDDIKAAVATAQRTPEPIERGTSPSEAGLIVTSTGEEFNISINPPSPSPDP